MERNREIRSVVPEVIDRLCDECVHDGFDYSPTYVVPIRMDGRTFVQRRSQ